jgi:hypothetical protein
VPAISTLKEGEEINTPSHQRGCYYGRNGSVAKEKKSVVVFLKGLEAKTN